MQRDPVCGMQVNENEAAGKSQHDGQTYYFCSTQCKEAFDKKPSQYIGHDRAEGQEWQGAGGGAHIEGNQPGQMQGMTGQSHTGREAGAGPQTGIGRRHEEIPSSKTERDKRGAKGRKTA